MAVLTLGIAILACQEATAASVSPTSLKFQAVQGGTSLSSQTISVNKGTNGPGTWTATESAAWLSLSPGAGTIKKTTQITVSINPSGLAAGSYTTTVFINLSKDGSTSFPVTLTISPASTTMGGPLRRRSLVWQVRWRRDPVCPSRWREVHRQPLIGLRSLQLEPPRART